MKPNPLLLIAGIVVAAVTIGCTAKPYYRQYVAGVAANHANLQTLRIGMTRPEVEAAMGSGVTVNHRKIQFRNPYRYETMRVSDQKTVEVLYYVTDGRVWESPERSTLTPLIFENGRLAGWGWAFLESDEPKYVSGPADLTEP